MSLVARVRCAALTLGVVLVPVTMQAQVNFDNLSAGSFVSVPAAYAGYNWYYGDGTFGSGNALQYSTLGAMCLSVGNCAYNANANTAMRIESLNATPASAFTFSGFFTGGYPGFGGGPVQLRAQGFVGGSSTAAYDLYFTMPTNNSWLQVNLTTTNVNKVLFSGADANGQPANGYFLLDDVTFGSAQGPVLPPVSTVPEPSTVLLMLAGLGATFVITRGRLQRR